jgi:APA family basic amino acid/polyamine antiporter
MLVALGAAGVLGTSWVYTASDFFAKYGAGGEIFGLAVGGLLAASIALAYAELASRFPRAGGEIVFACAAYGRRIAFIAGWLLVGAYVSSLAFYVTASGMLLAVLFPGLKSIPLYSIAGARVYLPVLGVGVLLTCVVWAFTAFGMRLAGTIQLLLFAAMVTIWLALLAVGFTTGNIDNFWPAYDQDSDPVTSTLRFVLPAMTFLTGFSLVSVLAEDAALPPRRVAHAVLLTVLIAATFYCTALLATAWLVPWQTTARLDEGVIDAFRTAGYPILAWGAYGISMLGLLTSFLALFSATSRALVALARAGLFPGALARLSPSGRPLNALFLTATLTLGLGWLGKGALLWLLDTGGVYIGLAWLIAVMSLYRIRRLHPEQSAPYPARPGWLPALGGFAAAAVIVACLLPGTGLSLVWPQEYLILAGWTLLGIAIYRLAPTTSEADTLAGVLGPEYQMLRPEG